MLIIAIFVIGLIAIRLSGGDLRRLNDLHIKWGPIALVALIAQITIISLWPNGWRVGHLIVHLTTYGALGLFLWANRHLAGIGVVAVGTTSNAVAIAVNGGVMPASASAMSISHLTTGPGFANSAFVAHPRLEFLGDIIPTPPWLPLHNVASIGDVLIVAGALLVVMYQIRQKGSANLV